MGVKRWIEGKRSMERKRIAIVTGASSGMGREFVRQIDRHTKTLDEIWVAARRKDRLLALQSEITNVPIRILEMDLCQSADLDNLADLLEEEKPAVRILVNAAGVGKAGYFHELSRKEVEQMVCLNDKALAVVTHIVIPYMTRPGNIIQIASASAFLPQKEFAVYAASKAFVLSFSRALHAELREKGIVVTAVCPGPVDTEFLALCNEGKEQKPSKQLVTVRPEPVVAKALRDAKSGRELSVYGLPMKMVHLASKFLPHSFLLH